MEVMTKLSQENVKVREIKLRKTLSRCPNGFLNMVSELRLVE